MTKDESRLDTWKEIAEYLNKDVRTVIRWEKERGLPVRRMPGSKRSPVYAWRSEIDGWLGTTEEIAPASRAPQSKGNRWWYVLGAMAVAISVVLAMLWLRPRRPQLGSPIQITSDGHEKGRLAISATSLFFVLNGSGYSTLRRLDLESGKQYSVPVPFLKPDLLDTSEDGSKILVAEQVEGGETPLWVVPSYGGPSRRLGRLCGTGAAWSRNGKVLAYADGPSLYLAEADGTNPKKFASLPSPSTDLRWSPDGKAVRLSVFGRDIEEQTWEIAADGSAPRRLLPGWLDSTGRWTPDGHFFIFPAFHGGGHGLWALRERSRFAAWLDRGPFQLASSLNGVWQPTVTKDGKKLFAIFTDPDRGELLRYDPTIHQFLAYPVPKGISGGQTTFAPDGKQIVYIKYPEMNLWRMNADGSNQQQLEERAALPQWSPDGQRIAYMGWDKGPNSPTTIRIVSSEGGAPLQAVAGPSWQGAPNWTPDGLAMIFGDNGPRFPITPSACLHRFDFRSGKTTNLQGSEGLWTARVCPAGRYVAALTLDYRKLVLYDLQTSTRTDLATFPDSTVGENPTWSKDGKWLYYDSPHSAHPAIYRISIPGKRIERVASLAGIPRVHGGISWWIGLTPDNQPLILKDIHSQEIYSMDWIAP